MGEGIHVPVVHVYTCICIYDSHLSILVVREPLDKPNVKLRRTKTCPELPLLNYRQRHSMWNSEDNYAKQEVINY